MYYRINEEATGGYLTAEDKRVALLSNPKPSAAYRTLYVACATEEEALLHFGLRAIPLSDPED